MFNIIISINPILCNFLYLVTTDRMFVANSSIKASRDKYDVRGKVPEVRIMMRIMRKIVMRIMVRMMRIMMRIMVSIMRIKVRIMRKIMMRIVRKIMVRIMVRIKRIMIPDARISVTEAMYDRSNDEDGTN